MLSGEIERWVDPATGQPRDGASLGLLPGLHAVLTPTRPALTIGDRTLDFATFDAAANARARALLTDGVGPGDRVVLAMRNRHEYLEGAFALWKIGAVPCPVSCRLVPEEFAAILHLSGAVRVIGEAGLPVPDALLHDVDRPLDPALATDPLPVAVSTPGKIANSGGSTGRPKLIVDPLPSVWGPDKEGLRRGPRQTILNPAPLHHSAPFNTMAMALAQGSHIVCMERFDAREWLQRVTHHRVTYAYLVPTMMARIARLPLTETATVDLSSIETLLHMAAPCPPDVKRWWIERLGADRVWEVYGGTERIGVTRIGGAEWLAHPGSVGRAAPGQSIEILGDDGRKLPAGQIGEIRFRREGQAPTGYAYVGAASRASGGSDGFGDMGWLDEDDYLHIADRRADMILVGGINVWPAMVEAVVEMLLGVVCCAVIGLPDADLGSRVHAIVELEPGAAPPDAGQMLERIAMRISGAARPRSIEFTTAAIRDEAGKVRRSALRDARVTG